MVRSSLCPSSEGFTWATGSRFHNTPVASESSSTFHLASIVNNDGVDQRFCIKKVDANDTLRPSWPRGRYCIYKKGPSCPYGLSEGWVSWDDNNKSNNNSQDGSVPSGTFDQNTKIFFCCQTVGNVFEAIFLPVDKPFYLIAFKSLFLPNNATCQEVHGTIATIEYIKFGTQKSSAARVGGRFPFGADEEPQYIYYCYYSSKLIIRTGPSFIPNNCLFQSKNFSSPNYLFTHPSIYSSIHPSISPTSFQPTIHYCIHSSTYSTSLHQVIYLPINPFTFPFIYPPIHLSIHPLKAS